MLLVHQNTGKENRYGKRTFLLYLSGHWGDLIEQIKKKSVIYTLSGMVVVNQAQGTCTWLDSLEYAKFHLNYKQWTTT